MRRIVLRLLVILALLLLTGAAGVYAWLGSSLPTIDGDVSAPGFAAPVTISRTEDGLPTITAETMTDAWRAVGFVHAQDRLWQMESLRRFALGRLSEVVGPSTLNLDAAQRRLGFSRLIAAQYAALDQETRAALDAYADGVNAYLATRRGALPIEFLLMGIDPEPWQPAQSLLWGRLMAYQLSGRWREDVARLSLYQDVGADKFRDAFPDDGMPVVQAAEMHLPLRLPPPTHAPPKGASNAWAVGAARSSSGAAQLAGDPHLGFSIPGTWYLLRMIVGGRIVEGATAPGTPFVIIGRNDRVAWSFTTNEADLQDVMRVTAADVTETISESITVEGAVPVGINLKFVDGAPVIAGGILDGSGDDGLALVATSLSPADSTPSTFVGLNAATDIDEAIKALGSFRAPLQNVILADADGRIARVLAGSLPKRLGESGRFPLSGPAQKWQSVPAADVVPPIVDPAGGTVSNANERTLELDQVPFQIPGDWPASARGQRLQKLLQREHMVSPDGMQAIQMDIADETFGLWRRMLEDATLSAAAQPVRLMLSVWNGRMDRDQPEPLIYATWMAMIEKALFGDELDGRHDGIRRPGPTRAYDMIIADSPWCDDIRTLDVAEACADLPGKAFEAAVMVLRQTYGDDASTWHWGDAHAARFRHQLLGRLPFGDMLFDRAIAADGGDRTLNRGGSYRGGATDGVFDDVHGPGLRTLHDFAGTPSRYIIVPGQSGNPLSPHYDDLLRRWRDGGMLGFDADLKHTLRLEPSTSVQNR